MALFAIPVAVEAAKAAGAGLCWLVESGLAAAGTTALGAWVESGAARHLGQKISDTVQCHFNPDCYFSENPYLAEARRRAVVEDMVMQFEAGVGRFASLPPAIPPGVEGDPMKGRHGGNLPGGGDSWLKLAIGTAATATVGGLVVYNVAGREPEGGREYRLEETPRSGGDAAAVEFTELDRAADACLDHFQTSLNRSITGSRSRGTEMTSRTFFQNMGENLRRAIDYLRQRGIAQCPGYNDFGIQTGTCQILAGFGDLMRYDTGERNFESALNTFANGSVRLDYGLAALTIEEVTALKRNPGQFQEVLLRYLRRICAPGALQRGSPHPRTAPAYGTGY